MKLPYLVFRCLYSKVTEFDFEMVGYWAYFRQLADFYGELACTVGKFFFSRFPRLKWLTDGRQLLQNIYSSSQNRRNEALLCIRRSDLVQGKICKEKV